MQFACVHIHHTPGCTHSLHTNIHMLVLALRRRRPRRICYCYCCYCMLAACWLVCLTCEFLLWRFDYLCNSKTIALKSRQHVTLALTWPPTWVVAATLSFLIFCFFVFLFLCFFVFFFCATAAPSVNTRHVGSRATHVANIKMHSLSGNATQRIWWTCSDKCGAKCTFTCWAPASALQMHHCQLLLKKMHTHTYTHSERKKIVLAHSTAMVSVVCERICNKMFYLQHDAFALLIHTYNH